MSRFLVLCTLILVAGFFVSCADEDPIVAPLSSDLTPQPLSKVGDPVFLSALDAVGLVEGDASRADADIVCDGFTTVAIDLISQNSIQENPADVMLVLDRSGSMNGTPLNDLKSAANAFVDLIDEASDGVVDGVITGSRVGVVSFSSSATLNRTLTGSAAAVKSAVNALSAGGNTAAGDGMNLAQTQLAGSSGLRIMIVVSDGNSNTGANANTAAANARAAGTEIFAIGFGGIDEAAIRNWATDPDATHAFFGPTSAELAQNFADIGAAIVQPGGTNVSLEATVFDHFAVTGESVTKGTVGLAGNVLKWDIDTLEDETVTLSFTVTHDPTTPGGIEQILTAISYTDEEGNTPSFPTLSVNVRGCPAEIDLEPDTAVNELYPGQKHSVTATVTDDFGDGVEGVAVDLEILSGPNAGVAATSVTDAAGEVGFMYGATQGLAGLGTDTIQGCFTNNAGVEVCDQVIKEWVDTTPPEVACAQGVNPAGNTPPPDNQDGFFLLEVFDLVDPDPQIYIDAGEGVVFGPFPTGTMIKYTETPGGKPRIRSGPGEVDWVIAGTQDMALFAVDASGNESTPISCLVPPPPSTPGTVTWNP